MPQPQSDSEHQQPLFFIIPQTRQYGHQGGKFLLAVLMQEPDSVKNFKKLKYFENEIEAILKATDNPKLSSFCPVCHRKAVTHFIVPDLDNYSPCFRSMVCSGKKCQEKVLEAFASPPESLRPINIRTVISFDDEHHRRVVCKFFREVVKLPKSLGGIELINWCRDILVAQETEF